MQLRHWILWFLLLTSPLSQAYQVQDGQILDNDQNTIQLRGLNWFGFETQNFVLHGLWARPWQDMLQQMQDLGFNALRIPFCPGTLQGQFPNSIDYNINPDLRGLNSLEILDKLMEELDRRGMYILLDHHRPDCQSISELWYTDSYSEEDWITDLTFIIRRYQTNSHLLGIDLKNEPHGRATWGANDPATDWNSAAERAVNALLPENDSILFFVEGIQENATCSSDTSHFWGGNLEPQRCTPLNIPQNRLVLSPHVYGPDVYQQDYFNNPLFPDNMPAIWDQQFGYLVEQKYAVIFGEFGGRYGHNGQFKDQQWQDALIAYMKERGINNYFYWAWNPNSGDTGGILQDNWSNVWDDKVALLQQLNTNAPTTEPNPDTTQESSTPTEPSPTTTPSLSPNKYSDNGQCELISELESQWQDGAVWQFTFKNHSNKPIYSWQIDWQMLSSARIDEYWNIELQRNDTDIRITAKDYNQQIPPGQQINFGMKIQSTANSRPENIQISAPNCGTAPLSPAEPANSDYIAGYRAAVRYCQQNPAACGLASQFDPENGALYIPQVQIPGSRWQVQLQNITIESCQQNPRAILFQILGLQQLTTQGIPLNP